MEQNNISVKKSPVKTLEEVNRGYSKYKTLRGKTNLFYQKTNDDILSEGIFPELASMYRSGRNKTPTDEHVFRMKDVDNKNLIEELARYATQNHDFFMNMTLSECISGDYDGFESEADTLSILVSQGKVEVILL